MDLKKSDQNSSKLQEAIDYTVEWTRKNDMKINAQKTHEMIISFSRDKPDPPPIDIEGDSIEMVDGAKLVGLNIQNNLKWDTHIKKMTRKAKKQLYFLLQLKRSKVPSNHLIHFYRSVIIPQLEYACPVWATSITAEQQAMLESIQKRALRIVYPELDYSSALHKSGLSSLKSRRDKLCYNFFQKMQKQSCVIHDILPSENSSHYSLRRNKKYSLPKTRTTRFKSSFVPYSLFNFQSM